MLLENLFSNVLDMSITASYVVIAVIIIRFIIKKAPKSFSFADNSQLIFVKSFFVVVKVQNLIDNDDKSKDIESSL